MQYYELYSAHSESSANSHWQLATDQVMGGVSQGELIAHAEAVSLKGTVSFENNGGFVQMKWPIAKDLNIGKFSGFWCEVKASQAMQLDAVLKSSQLWMPWQSYRHTVGVNQQWTMVEIPFVAFTPYRTRTQLNPNRITQFALLIGQEGVHEIDVRRFGLFK